MRFYIGASSAGTIAGGFYGKFMTLYRYRIGITPWKLGIVGTISNVWDAVNDPILGAWLDHRKPGKGGKYTPMVRYMAIPVAVMSLISMLIPLGFSEFSKLAYILSLAIVGDIFGTLFGASNNAILARVSPLSSDRSKIVFWNQIFTEVAGLIPQGIFLLADEKNMERIKNKTGINYTFESLVKTLTVFIGIFIHPFIGLGGFVKEKVVSDEPQISFLRELTLVLQNRTLMLSVIGSLVSNLSVKMNEYYFFQYMDVGFHWFGKSIDGLNALAIFGVLTSIPAALGLPFTNKVITKYGQKTTIQLLQLSTIVSNTIAYFIGYKGQRFFFSMIVLALSTFCRSWHGPAFTTIILDSIDEIEYKTGSRNEASTFAVRGVLLKLVGGLGALSDGVSLSLLDFDPKPANGVVQITDTFKKRAWPFYMLGPVAAALWQFITYSFINFTGEKKARIQAELRERRALQAIQRDESNSEIFN
jgi:glycoside/pentoside/hexuronide:cation symporter, GPH family